MFLALSADEDEVALDIGEGIEDTQGTAHIEVVAGERPPSIRILPSDFLWSEEGVVGFELHLKFYFVLNLSMWQHPTTLDGWPLTIVLFFIEAIFFLLYNTTENNLP